mmetsp:Transcript_10357/g.24879  ORF Transcript_10357/g.24879 Transcript_10357/m.24879 type:complete len:238 (+) Transcript_10357:118-831(+)
MHKASASLTVIVKNLKQHTNRRIRPYHWKNVLTAALLSLSPPPPSSSPPLSPPSSSLTYLSTMSSSSSSSPSGPLACSRRTNTEKCVPCSTLDLTAKLTFEQATEQMSSMLNSGSDKEEETGQGQSLWTLRERRGKDPSSSSSPTTTYSLVRTFTAKNFQAALDSINEMGGISEREGHHPDFHLTNYRDVEIEIFTHKLDGLTMNDFVLAKQLTDEVSVVYSPKWLKSHPEAQRTSK